MARKLISVYADGSSTGNSKGPTGWGWLVTDWNEILTAGCEGASTGTNNMAELHAALRGLQAVVERGLHIDNDVELVTDSMYTLHLASGAHVAKKNNEIVNRLQAVYAECKCRGRWVKGHNGDIFNEKVDELAKSGRDKYTIGESRKRRRSRKREERRRRRAIVKEFKRRVYGSLSWHLV